MPSLYILKFLCAFFVVIIHTAISGKGAFAPLIYSAVPCFYLCTGFFLYSDNREIEFDRLKRWCLKAILLLVALNFLYLSIEVLRDYRKFSWYEWPQSIFTGGIIIIHLWYLSSLWQGLVLVWLLRRISAKLLIICPLLYIVFYGLNPVFFHIELGTFNTWQEHLISITRSSCFLAIGYLLAWKNYKSLYSIRWDIYMFILFFILMKIKPFSDGMFHITCIIFEACSLFGIAIKADKLRIPFAESIGKHHAANIYFYHFLIIWLYNSITYHYPSTQIIGNQNKAIPIFILTLFFSIFVNASVKYLSKIKKESIRKNEL